MSATTLLSAFHTSAQYCSQRTVREASPKWTLTEGWVDTDVLSHAAVSPCLLFYLLGVVFSGKREAGWGAGALASQNPPLPSLLCICSPNQHQAAHPSYAITPVPPSESICPLVYRIQLQRLRPGLRRLHTGSWTS